jgi:selenophosphate synthetase-related protein
MRTFLFTKASNKSNTAVVAIVQAQDERQAEDKLITHVKANAAHYSVEVVGQLVVAERMELFDDVSVITVTAGGK